MADLVPVPADVRALSGSTVETATAAEALAPGESIIVSSAKQASLAQADDIATSNVRGVVVSYADTGDVVSYVSLGAMDLGVTLTVGVTYSASAAAAGGIAPSTDLVATNIGQTIGIATSSSRLIVSIHNTSEALA